MPFDLKSKIADHHKFFSGRSIFILKRRNPPGEAIECYGHRGRLDKARMTLFGGTIGLEQIDAVIEIWQEGFEETFEVNNGDELIDADGTRYLVLGRFYCDRTSRFECACQKLDPER
jgi:hypothetical protein